LKLISEKKKYFKNQSNHFKDTFKPNNNLIPSYFSIYHYIEKLVKPLAAGKFIKEVFLVNYFISIF